MNKIINILLIEDNPGDALLIREMLKEGERTVFKVVHDKKLDDGLKHFYNEDFDVILLDLGLSDSQGIETFNRIKNVASKVPIIILTGLSDKEFAINTMSKGAQDYLVKSYLDSILLDRAIHYAIERKRIEEKLKESEERYRVMVEKTRSGVFRINSRNELNYINKHMAEMLGYQENEIINRSIFDFMDREGRKNLNDHIKRIKNRTGDIHELQFINKDGSKLWALASTNPLFNANNDFLGAVSIITDISARKGVEKNLMDAMIEKDNTFRLIMSNMMEAVKPLIASEYSESYSDKLT
jgi:two-component system sensor histidine kinase UhpB